MRRAVRNENRTRPWRALTAAAVAVVSSGSPASATPLPTLTILCTDDPADVYVTPGGLPPWGPGVLGDVVRCAEGTTISVSEVATRLASAGVEGVTPTSGATTYTIAYRTTREDGVEGVGTARLFLPDTVVDEAPLPVVVATHGTLGLADHCAPSRYESISDYIVLPFVGRGFVVVAPDYAGLGNEGVQGYRKKGDTAHSVLDAARAVRGIVLAPSLAPGTIVEGHSQGGGAALSAQAFDAAYGEGDVLGVAAFAPGWTIDTEALRLLVTFSGFVPFDAGSAPFVSLELFADAANALGAGHEVDFFHPDIRSDVAEAIADDCILGLQFSLPQLAFTYAGALDPSFVDTTRDCLNGEPACAEPGLGVAARQLANLVDADPGGGAIRVVQGLEDTLATPGNTACIVKKLTEDGAPPQVCAVADADHGDIVERTVADVVDWALALTAGDPLPDCPTVALPVCGEEIFSDGFESGDTGEWTDSTGV